MDRKSKIFLWIFSLLIVASVGVTYYRIMIKKDYIIEAEADCDPTMEACFVYYCDAETEECTGDEVEDTSYYKLVRRSASKIPLCDPNDETCQPLICEENEKDCEEILCSEQTMQEGDECNDPVQYNLDNPAEEEEVDCDPEVDEDCAVDEEAACDPEVEEGCVVDEEAACDPATDPTCETDVTEEEIDNTADAVKGDSLDNADTTISQE